MRKLNHKGMMSRWRMRRRFKPLRAEKETKKSDEIAWDDLNKELGEE